MIYRLRLGMERYKTKMADTYISHVSTLYKFYATVHFFLFFNTLQVTTKAISHDRYCIFLKYLP
jgi:hypothetical protein